MRSPRRTGYPVRLAAIVLAGALFRIAFIERQPLWRDEAFTALAINHPAERMLDIVGRDSAPPLSYLADFLVAHVLPASPLTLRLVSFLAGTSAIVLAGALGRRTLGDRGGLWGAAVMAVLPTTVLNSRDARMYALVAALTLAAALALWRFVEAPRWERWAMLTALAALALQTDYFALPALLALGAAALIAWRPPPRVWAGIGAAGVLALATLVPWVTLRAQAQFSHSQSPFWVEPLGIKTIGGTLAQFFSGPPVDPGTPFKLLLQTFQGIAIAAGALALVVLLRRGRTLTRAQQRACVFLGIGGGGGALLLAVVSLWRPLLDARYVSAGWEPLVVLIGIGIALLDATRMRAALAGLLVASAAVLSIAATNPDTPAALAVIAARPDVTFVSASPAEYLLLQYYADAQTAAATHIVATDVPWFWGTAAYPPGAVLPSVPGDVLRGQHPIVSVDEATVDAASPAPGYHVSGVFCVTGTCVTVFVPG